MATPQEEALADKLAEMQEKDGLQSIHVAWTAEAAGATRAELAASVLEALNAPEVIDPNADLL